ncbi:hypothetical protein ACFS5L_37415 [Streptomyces phyllanthi]|uniref:hypothetical protein n=1 Tax=Streptomyces phyllanthi TaxID=1803180 RepID=UPI0018838F1C|nr:hypothetical protein [Streptomyces phyllanthi]
MTTKATGFSEPAMTPVLALAQQPHRTRGRAALRAGQRRKRNLMRLLDQHGL